MRDHKRLWLAWALCLCAAGLLIACSDNGGGGGPQPPPVGQWQQNCNATINGNVLTFPNSSPGACYMWTGLKAKQGQTLTLNYSVSGNNPVWQNNPTGGDTGAPTIHLLLWRKGDDQLCGAVTKQYRMFAARTELVIGDNQVVSAVLNPSAWLGCYGNPDTVAQFDDLLANLLGAGVTFGGQWFAGHGVYVSPGTASFKINSLTVQ